MESECPVCKDFLFYSDTPVKCLPCGHFMHTSCFQAYTKHYYTCPLCRKSLGDFSAYFRMLDAILADYRSRLKLGSDYSADDFDKDRDRSAADRAAELIRKLETERARQRADRAPPTARAAAAGARAAAAAAARRWSAGSSPRRGRRPTPSSPSRTPRATRSSTTRSRAGSR